MNGTWRYAFGCALMAMALLFATGHAVAAPSNPQVLHAFCFGGQDGCTAEQEKFGREAQDVVAGSDGAYYGTTFFSTVDAGGGVVYRADPLTRKISVLYQFPEDYYPARWLRAGADGYLYGGYLHSTNEFYDWLSEGFFRLSPDGDFTIIFDETKDQGFSCNAPVQDSLGSWIGEVGSIYSYKNYIYKFTPSGSFKILRTLSLYEHFYCPNGGPVLAADGNLYGVIAGGVDPIIGAIYRLAPDDTFTIVHQFVRPTDGVPLTSLAIGPDGALYGIAQRYVQTSMYVNTLYRISLDGQFTDQAAFGPESLAYFSKFTLMPDGYFYGSAFGGSHGDDNVLFRLSPAGEYTQLYVNPDVVQNSAISTMIRGFDNVLYGTDPYNGKHGGGVLFRYVPPPVQ